MRKISKLNSDKFISRMHNELLKMGATKVSDIHNDIVLSERYELMTKAGKLLISLDKEHVHCFSLFTRFEDVDRAKLLKLYHLNEYSGKFNFHIGTLKPKEAIDEIVDELLNLI